MAASTTSTTGGNGGGSNNMQTITAHHEELLAEPIEREIDILFVIDFECNQPECEIIEFPVIVVDLRAHSIIDTFHAYVRPTITPILSQFIKDLTGIE